MILPNPKEAHHKLVMSRFLIHLLEDPKLPFYLYFKGGTCAGMLGWLDRFSVDLDFDLSPKASKDWVRKRVKQIAQTPGLNLKQESKKELFFVFFYQPPHPGWRSKLKLSIVSNPPKSNKYATFFLPEIKHFAICQTKATMFANKLVAPLDRFQKYRTIAGRDIYDIHQFFLQNFPFSKEVIKERTGLKTKEFFLKLFHFIRKHRVILQNSH